MSTVQELHQIIMSTVMFDDSTIDNLVSQSDVSYHKTYFDKNNKDTSKELVKQLAAQVVNTQLNNTDVNQVPIRTKTRWLLLLNNLSLYKPVRGKVFDAVKNMDAGLEEAMKKEGTMPFDSELGRMSEHVLVLLMRVCQYKFKAAAVNEFAEGNTQFGVQLLLAVLLKEPPYEFELRCNCISGLLGFTQPQAFFTAGESIEFNSCANFSEKIDFILALCMRLGAIQVVNDVVTPQLLDSQMVQPIVHLAVTNTMRAVMNIHAFATQGATQWRQHILLSTSFVDGVTILYVQAQIRSLESLLTVTMAKSTPALPPELLPGIVLSLKFMAFATFHMGQHGKAIRPMCSFIHDLTTLPLGAYMSHPQLGKTLMGLFTHLFHLVANIDALAGDDNCVQDLDELIPELRSQTLVGTIGNFISNEIGAAGGGAALESFHQNFYKIDADALVSQDSQSFQIIDQLFIKAKQQVGGAQAPAASAPPPQEEKKRLLGDMPSLGQPGSVPAHKEKKAPLSDAVAIKQSYVAPSKAAQSSNSALVCALNGHTMKCPVTSPYGHTFEKDTIEGWIKQQGSICPITGKPLSIDQLSVNKELQNQIMMAQVRQTMAQDNYEDNVDLYEF